MCSASLHLKTDTIKHILTYAAALVMLSCIPASAEHIHDFISPEYAALKLKKNTRDFVIVDIRNPQDYKKVHIPGALNMPLAFIKSKPFLKKKQILIADNGFFLRPIMAELSKLREKGFTVSILNGGLNAWLSKDLPVRASVFSREEFFLVDPRKAYQEKSIHPVLYVNACKERISPEQFREALCLQDNTQKAFLKIIDFNRTTPRGSVLVFNNFGEGYDKLRKKMLSKKINNLFFLKGGLHAYAKYLHNLRLSRAPRKQRLKRIGKCSNCN